MNIWTVFQTIKNQQFRPESVKAVYQDLSAVPQEEQAKWIQNKKEKIGTEPSYTGNLILEKELFAELTKNLQQTQNYDLYLEEIEQKAEQMTSVIFSDDRSYAYRSAQKTPAVFKKLKGIHVTTDVSEGVILATRSEFTDFCMFLIIIAAVYFLIFEERKFKLYALLKSTYRGRQSVIRAKVFSGAGIVLFCVLVFYGGNYLIGCCKYGFGDPARPVQSVTILYESPFRLSVLEYLVLYLVLKFIVCYVILLLAMLFAQKVKGSAGLLAAATGAAGIEYLLIRFLPSSSYLDFLRYINIMEYIKVYPVFEKYRNLNFLDYPVSSGKVFAVFILFMAVLLYFVNCKSFRRTPKVRIRREKEGPHYFRKKVIIVPDLFLHELYKVCFVHKAIILGGALLAAAIVLSRGNIEYSDMSEDAYRYYMLENEGGLTWEKVQYFEEKKEEYDIIFSMTAEESGLSEEEVLHKKSNAMYTYGGFMRAYNQVQYVLGRNASDPEHGLCLVYETGFEILLGERSIMYTGSMILLCVIAAVYTASVSLGKEYDLQVINLLRSTRYGRRNLLCNKFLSVSFFVFITAILVRIPMLQQIGRQYPMALWNVRVQSLSSASQFTGNYTIAEYVILVFVGQFLGMMILILAVMALSTWVKDSIITMVIAAVVFILPLILEWNGFFVVSQFSLNGLLETHRLLQSSNTIKVCYAMMFIIALPSACIWSFHKTCKGSR